MVFDYRAISVFMLRWPIFFNSSIVSNSIYAKLLRKYGVLFTMIFFLIISAEICHQTSLLLESHVHRLSMSIFGNLIIISYLLELKEGIKLNDLCSLCISLKSYFLKSYLNCTFKRFVVKIIRDIV